METTLNLFEGIDPHQFKTFIAWLILYYGAVIVAMGIDLWAGVAKARKAGLARRSTGYKRTCDKAGKYFFPMLCLSCIDLIACTLLPLPLFTLALAAFNLFCEYRSVMENTREKAEMRRAEKTMRIILENKDEIAKALAKLLMKGID
ncbi:MAG: phage holin family protein [Pseudoflavonifractor sp.]|nr:phage holin family protein [Alloprevotella sp.]MCM1117539.1 phage holin family protein [Pseudoflavonifractor sp.]